MSFYEYQYILRQYNWTGQDGGLTGANIAIVPSRAVSEQNGNFQIKYAFLDSSVDVAAAGFSAGSGESQNFAGLTTAQAAFANYALASSNPTGFNDLYTDVANIRFVNSAASTANITFGALNNAGGNFYGESDPQNLIAAATYNYRSSAPQTAPISTDPFLYGKIWINNAFPSNWQSTGPYIDLNAWAILHEVGHSLGLKHPVEANSIQGFGNDASLDTMQYTIMSDNTLPGMLINNPSTATHPRYPIGLQLYDIAAVQSIYGANYNTRAGDTLYGVNHGFGPDTLTPFIYTIWDGGGVDTISASPFTVHAFIDLRQGNFSSIGNAEDSNFNYANDPNYHAGAFNGFTFQTGQAANNVAIAFHAVIENAIGTSGDDVIIGNAWGNTLNGGAGSDKLYGSGLDYDGSVGFTDTNGDIDHDPNARVPTQDNDTLIGGAGNDTLYGGTGMDTVDYSTDNANGGMGAITAHLTSPGEGTVTDGWGNTDTLHSIERIVGTASDDTFYLTAPSGFAINGGGGSDTALYTQPVVYDVAKGLVWDQNGLTHDALTGFGATGIDTHGGRVLPNYAASGSIPASGADFSAYAGNAVITIKANGYMNAYHPYGSTTEWEVDGHASASASIQLPNGALFVGNDDATLASGVWSDLGTALSIVRGQALDAHAAIEGSNHNDTVIFKDETYGGPPAIYLSFDSGTGNDDITMADNSDARSHMTALVEYRGGTDVIHNANNLGQLNIWEGLSLTDYTGYGFSGANNDCSLTIHFKNGGSVELAGLDLTASIIPNISFLSGGDLYINSSGAVTSYGQADEYLTTISGTWATIRSRPGRVLQRYTAWAATTR